MQAGNPTRATDRRGAELAGTDGQIWVAALLAFMPLLVLVLSFMNTNIVTVDRVRRQNAADSAALAALTPSATAMNLIANNNIAMTYLMGEAIAEEALLRAVKRARAVACSELCAAELACEGSVGILAAACALIPVLEFQAGYLACLETELGETLKPMCAFPGDDGYPRGGTLFVAMKQLEGASTAAAGTPMPWQGAEDHAARAGGSEGAAIWPREPTLPVQLGEFRDLAAPTRYGSQGPESGVGRQFVRGYSPILGLPPNKGPLEECARKYRSLLLPAYLTGAPEIYDSMLGDVYRDWFRLPPGSRPEFRGVFDYEEARRNAGRVTWVSWVRLHVETVAMAGEEPPTPLEVLGSGIEMSGDGELTDGLTYRISGTSATVDHERSNGTVKVFGDGWRDLLRDEDASNLRNVRPGTWQIGRATTTLVQSGPPPQYRHGYDFILFQAAYISEGTGVSASDDLPDPESEAEDQVWDDALPIPHVLDGLEMNGDVAVFRAAESRLVVVWGDGPELIGAAAFRPLPDTHIAYAQGEIYNGTSWDLFTADWRVRLVPAALLDAPPSESASLLPPGAPVEASNLITMPRGLMPWLNNH